MPAMFVEANKQALALERIAGEQKKQFVSVRFIDAQTTEGSLDIEQAAVQAKSWTSDMDQKVKVEGLEAKLIEDPNQEDKMADNKAYSNSKCLA